MNLLLDTHVLIWWMKNDPRLGKISRTLLRSGANTMWVSSASIWEISIKASLNRLSVPAAFAEFAASDLDRGGFRRLTITFEHALAVRDLTLHHGDPFDRMLVAQAKCENLALLTADSSLAGYGIHTVDALT
jgi:PIN domain nuclease of toxin-antitoxin system